MLSEPAPGSHTRRLRPHSSPHHSLSLTPGRNVHREPFRQTVPWSAILTCTVLTLTYPKATLQTITSSFRSFIDTAPSQTRLGYFQLLRTDGVRRSWITTLQKLRAYERSATTSKVIDIWLQLGRGYGFNESAEASWLRRGNHAQASHRPGAHPWEYCAWSECICHEQRPLSRLRGCNGCGAAYYCGPSCQKK